MHLELLYFAVIWSVQDALCSAPHAATLLYFKGHRMELSEAIVVDILCA